MELTKSELLSSVKGVVHGFSDKSLGGDASNMANILNLSGISLLKQIHSDRVIQINKPDQNSEVFEGDAQVTDLKSLGIGVVTADCVPILIASSDGRAAAAVHAGWRGTLSGIVVNTVSLLKDKYGVAPGDLKAAIGPSIGGCCYEVGGEVGSLFVEKYEDADRYLSERMNEKFMLDLGMANRLLLNKAGVYDVEVLNICTKCNQDYYSYRGDGKGTGRQLSVIALTS